MTISFHLIRLLHQHRGFNEGLIRVKSGLLIVFRLENKLGFNGS